MNALLGLTAAPTELTFLQMAMVKNRVSQHDLLEDLRLNGNVGSAGQARLAVLERNGQISVVRRPNG